MIEDRGFCLAPPVPFAVSGLTQPKLAGFFGGNRSPERQTLNIFSLPFYPCPVVLIISIVVDKFWIYS